MALSKNTREIIEPKDIYIGNPGVPVTIKFYVDYESLKCMQANEVVSAVYLANADRVRLNVRHFPLANKHQKAMKAAEAAVAAGQEGKLWEMHQLLFQNRKHLGLISLKKYAKEAGVQSRNFLDELVNGRYAWAVRTDLMEAVGKGIRDVPAILVNDHLFEEEITIENLQRFIGDVKKAADQQD